MRRQLNDRLLYIICSQNWEAIGPHYWIKQCIELILVTSTSNRKIQMAHESGILPSISSVLDQAEQQTRNDLFKYEVENPQLYENMEIKEESLDIDMCNVDSNQGLEEKPLTRVEKITKLLSEHFKFIELCRNITTDQFLNSVSQLCHLDTSLAEQVWLQLFPRLWVNMDEVQRNNFTLEVLPFITSGTHIIQKDCHPSAIGTFVEALSRCNPSIHIAA